MKTLGGGAKPSGVDAIDLLPTRRDVLAVDDDPRNLLALEAALGPLAPRLLPVRTGVDALRRLLTNEFAVVLLDVRMPDLDGFETARLIRARQRTRHVPIIFMTAYREAEVDMRRGYDLGAVDYLFKPIVPEVLQAKVSVFVALRERIEQVARQAEKLFQLERAAAERRLVDERHQWEERALKRQVDEQRAINCRLEDADRQKDEFIAMLAHELRNPLAPIVAGLELLRTAADDEKVVERAQRAMERQVGHLTRMVDDLLDVSRVDRDKVELQRRRVTVTEVVGWAVEACRQQIEAGRHQLSLHPASTPVVLHGDPVRLTQVVSNLLSNACRYSPPGHPIEIRWDLDGTTARILVVDRGCGIPPELIDRVFERFVQARNNGRGLGLGLTLVRQLVTLHGGTVDVVSEGEGRGSTFTVRLPLPASGEVALAPSTPPGRVEEPADTGPRDVFIVEDDPDIRETMEWLLSTFGHRVRAAATGEQALEMMREAPPDVALVDIGLPGIDGLTLAMRLREILDESALPRLVALSGYGRPCDRERTTEAGFHAHLVKPASSDALRAAIESAGRRKRDA